MQAAASGRAESIHTLFERLADVTGILAALNRKEGATLDEEDLMDLAQDVAVIVWTKRPESSSLSLLESWVHRVVYFEYRNASRRKTWLRVRLGGDFSESLAASEHPEASNENGVDEIEQALAGLNAGERAVIQLRYDEGLTFEAMAARLALPANTLKSRCHRGLAKLRAGLERKQRQEKHAR